jgi:drug/metabolite transporter (DMT)-like permease
VSRDRPRPPVLALVVGVLAVSFAAICFKKAAPTHPLTMSGIRLALAAVLLSPLVVRGRRAGRLSGPVLRGAVLAGLFYALHFGAWVTSLTLTSVAASVTLVTATPILLGVVGWITGRDRPDRRLWGAIGLALIGLIVVGRSDFALSGDALLGDALALVGAAGMAGCLLVARRFDELDVPAYMGVACAVGAVVLLSLGALLGVDLAPASRAALGWIVLSALLPQLVGHQLLTWALRRAAPTVVGLATVGEPVVATALGVFMLGEMVDTGTAVGCSITLAGVLLAVMGRNGDGQNVPDS